MAAKLKPDHLYYGLLALVVLAPLIFFPSLISLYRLPKIAFISLFVTLLLWLWLFLLVQERERKTVFPLLIPLVLYLGISALSLFKATNLLEGAVALLPEAAYIFLFWLVVNQIRTIESAKKLLLCATFAAFIVSLIGIYQMFGGDIPGLVSLAPPGSTFGNKNMAAQFILLTLPFPYMFLLSAADRQKETLSAIAAAVVSTYLLYTGTRAAWAGAIIGSSALLILLRLKMSATDFAGLRALVARKTIPLMGIVIFTLVMNSIPPYLVSGWKVAETPSASSRFSTIADIDQDTSFLNRLAMWANTWEMFKDHPWLGVGKGNFKIVYSLYAEKKIKDPGFTSEMQPREAHNDYIQLLGETGVFGLLSFLSLLLLLALRAWAAIPGKKDPAWLSLIFTLSFSLIAILVDAFLDFPFELPVSEALFWIFAGLLWVSCENNRASENSRLRANGALRFCEWNLGDLSGRLAVGLLSVVSILIAALHLTLLRAEFHFSRGVSLAQEQPSELALQELKEAESLNPAAYRYSLFRGLVALRMKRYQEAVEANLRSLKSNPYYINAYTNLGVAYASMGKVKEAEKAWQTALEIWPDHNDARNNLATVYSLHGRSEEAIALLRDSLRRNPADETAKKKLEKLLHASLRAPG